VNHISCVEILLFSSRKYRKIPEKEEQDIHPGND
jgi:hypothetical protein